MDIMREVGVGSDDHKNLALSINMDFYVNTYFFLLSSAIAVTLRLAIKAEAVLFEQGA